MILFSAEEKKTFCVLKEAKMPEGKKRYKEVLLPRGMTENAYLNGCLDNDCPDLAKEAHLTRYGGSNYDRVHLSVLTDLSVSELEEKISKFK